MGTFIISPYAVAASLLSSSEMMNVPITHFAVNSFTNPHDTAPVSQVPLQGTDTATAQVDGHRNQPG
jgi:hypothetical protein